MQVPKAATKGELPYPERWIVSSALSMPRHRQQPLLTSASPPYETRIDTIRKGRGDAGIYSWEL
jgi:hypothetical protein